MIIRRDRFFARVRASFGKLGQHQVDGFTAILDEWERRQLTDARWLADMLATSWHETATRMQPVMETRRADEEKNPSVDQAIARLESSWARGKMPWVKKPYWRKDARGLSWLGRGLPQCTHEFNYAWAQQETGVPFLTDPDLMLVMGNAIPVMFIGMIEGRFTGKKLGDYFNATTDDPINARRIINGVESAAKVAGHHQRFLDAIRASI